MTALQDARREAVLALVGFDSSTEPVTVRDVAVADALRAMLNATDSGGERSLTSTYQFPTDDRPALVTHTVSGDVTEDDVIDVMLDVLEATFATATAREFEQSRGPLSPVMSDDDRRNYIGMNARLALITEIANRLPPLASTIPD